jgi:hypothetical protein
MSVIELITSVSAFWPATAEAYRNANPKTTDTKDGRMKEALFTLPSARVTWLCALFLLGYVGIEVALGGWIVKFMLEVRHGAPFASGMTATGFWMGLTVGRVILGFVTPRIGEKLAITVCIFTACYSKSIYQLRTDIPAHSNGAGTPLLACSSILCLRRRSRVPGIFPRPSLSRCSGCSNEVASAPFAC